MSGTCPTCGEHLGGLAAYCWRCDEYTADMGKPSPANVTAPKIPDTRPEAEIRLAIRRVLELHGFHVWDTEQNRPTRVHAGLPDLFAMAQGRYTWVEVKRASGKLSEAQHAFRRYCDESGMPYQVWRSETEAIQWCKQEEAA